MSSKQSLLASVALTFNFLLQAQFAPIPLTPDSFNQDLIVERTAPGPVVTVTTASMEGGTNNIGYSWYERGFNANSPASGLPLAGTIRAGETAADHEFQLPPTYRTNNALLLDSDRRSGSLVPTVPAAYAALSILTSSGNTKSTLGYTVQHQDGTSESGTFDSPNWMGEVGQDVTTYGRIDVQKYVFDGVTYANPRLYLRDVLLTNTSSPVTRLDFTWNAGAGGHAAIFAVSGAVVRGEPFSPVPVAGFSYDLVVEAAANRPGCLGSVTSATLEHGAANTARTLFEKGYLATLPASGLPAAGSIVMDAAIPQHHFQLPPSYGLNNAALVDALTPSAALVPISPIAVRVLSLLCTAAAGPVTNACRVQHADGHDEVQNIVIPDWFGPGPAVLDLSACVNTDDRFPFLPGAGAPRLFAVDLALANPRARSPTF